jgi:hypothetical protein
MLTAFDKAREFFAPCLGPSHESLRSAIEVATVMLHSYCASLEVAEANVEAKADQCVKAALGKSLRA